MLKDENVIIRALEPEDLEYIYKWENDIDLWDVSDTLTPLSRYALKKSIEQSDSDIYSTKQLRFMVESQDDNLPVGLVDIYDFDPFHMRAGVGIMIYSVKDRKKGYASSAIKLVKDYLFELLGLHQIYCCVPNCNVASIKLFESLNFIQTGYRKDWLKRGKYWEDVVYFQKISDLN